MDTDSTRYLHERDASREEGDLLARAALQAIKTGDTRLLSGALYEYMLEEALIDRNFFLDMQTKERFLVALFRYLVPR